MTLVFVQSIVQSIVPIQLRFTYVAFIAALNLIFSDDSCFSFRERARAMDRELIAEGQKREGFESRAKDSERRTGGESHINGAVRERDRDRDIDRSPSRFRNDTSSYHNEGSLNHSSMGRSNENTRRIVQYGIYRGKITNVMDFGCFVEISGASMPPNSSNNNRSKNSAEGLVHVSQIVSRRISSARDVVKKGDDVWVKVCFIFNVMF